MKRFWFGLVLGFALGMVGTLVTVTAWWLFAGSSSFSYVGTGHTPPDLESTEGAGLKVTLGGSHGHSVVFSRNDGEFTFTPPAGEVCKFPAVSADGRTVFLMVQKEEQFGYDYGCLLRFVFADGPLVQTQPQRILAPPQLVSLFGGRRAWVSSLHKVSPAGDAILLNISAEDTNRSSGASTYYSDHPYWYDFKSNSIREP